MSGREDIHPTAAIIIRLVAQFEAQGHDGITAAEMAREECLRSYPGMLDPYMGMYRGPPGLTFDQSGNPVEPHIMPNIVTITRAPAFAPQPPYNGPYISDSGSEHSENDPRRRIREARNRRVAQPQPRVDLTQYHVQPLRRRRTEIEPRQPPRTDSTPRPLPRPRGSNTRVREAFQTQAPTAAPNTPPNNVRESSNPVSNFRRITPRPSNTNIIQAGSSDQARGAPSFNPGYSPTVVVPASAMPPTLTRFGPLIGTEEHRRAMAEQEDKERRERRERR